MKQEDLSTRDYDFSTIQEDRRFLRCRRETIVALIVAILLVVLPEAITLLPKWGPVSGYRYMLGMPMWFTLAYATVIACCIFALLYSILGIREDPLDDEEDVNSDLPNEEAKS